MSGYPPHLPPQGHAWHGAPPPQPASLSWPQIIGLSTWLVFPLLGCGCLGGAAMIFIGAYARRPSWWISGIGYTAVAAISFVVTGSAPQGSVVTNVAVGVFLVSWFACLIHAVVINFLWIRVMATRSAPPAWSSYQPPAPPGAWAAAPGSPVHPAALPPDAPDYYGTDAVPGSGGPALSEYSIEFPAPHTERPRDV